MDSGERYVGLPEQITDRAIESLEEDRFGHEDFVGRLAMIVRSTETPANIALFGRWGSGKTGIGNRLQAELRGHDGLRFVHFDAFKFARLPLLRQFLIRIAEELGGSEAGERYRQAVYERRERVRLGRRDWLRSAIVNWAAYGLLALAALIWLFDLLALFALTESQLNVALDLLGAVFPVLLPSALVAAAVAFGARHLSVTTVVEAPTSEEQFERLFARLLAEQGVGDGPGRERLVVFVDELDRCSAVEVARTLESLKTFLEQPGCVFVVAADRTVLEHALTRRVRQATPRDTTNPYYSAGSAYLDKIFPYQLNLPPLFPGRLTDFAARLLEDVGGVWEEVERKDDVVSVLLPVTVRSPRRVKVLLNAFAQEFALALVRSRSGVLDEDVKDRVEEVAKLVCLQVEFPLFAADLPIDPDLPSLVLACADALARNESPKEARAMRGVSVPVGERAIGYAEGRLPTDESIDSADENKAMTQAQGNDLLDYLRQTRLVAGPGSDLVRLEGLGISAGLDEALAIELNDLALKNRPEEVRRKLEELGEEERVRAVLWLRDLVRESRGIDRDNALLSLLISSSTVSLSLLPVSVDLLAAIFRYDTERGLPDEALPGALDLAIRGRGLSMQRSLLGRPKALGEPLRGHAITRADLLLARHGDRLGELLLAEITESPEVAARRLSE